MHNFDAKIDRFMSHFREEVKHIGEIQGGEGSHERAYKKVLFFAVIDSLSKSIFPKKGNRDRIVSFVEEFSEWKNRSRISLPHLVQLLLKSPEPPFTNLREFSYEKISKWSNGREIKLNQDPENNEVAKLWPSEKEHKKPLQGLSIESLQHKHLFYSYRNYLIHELREPGYGIEHIEDNEPYYISVSHLSKKENGEKNETWELVYPVLFLKELIETSMGNMEKYLIKNKINPYMSYTFGSYWLNKLN